MAVATNLRVTINFYKKQYLPAITWNKEHSSKEVVSMIHTLGKDFLAAADFKCL